LPGSWRAGAGDTEVTRRERIIDVDDVRHQPFSFVLQPDALTHAYMRLSRSIYTFVNGNFGDADRGHPDAQACKGCMTKLAILAAIVRDRRFAERARKLRPVQAKRAAARRNERRCPLRRARSGLTREPSPDSGPAQE
jgi:hypothetical protein